MEATTTIFFENPLWVGVFERRDERGYAVARHVFGSEPNEAELLLFARTNYQQLSFSQPGPDEPLKQIEFGYKRKQRRAREQMAQQGIGTHAQQAMKAELERRKVESKTLTRAEEDALAEEKYQERQQRKKEKLRGH